MTGSRIGRGGLILVALGGILAGGSAFAEDINEPATEPTTIVQGEYPDITNADKSAAKSAIGKTTGASSGAYKRLGLVIPGSPSLQNEGVWHVGNNKLGVVREYVYSLPINLPVQDWQITRQLKGASSYKLGAPSFGVIGLQRIQVYVDLRKGDVVAIEPVEFEALTDVTLPADAGIDAEEGE
jgi:hypothetical protein